jgi:hypothetical protein
MPDRLAPNKSLERVLNAVFQLAIAKGSKAGGSGAVRHKERVLR